MAIENIISHISSNLTSKGDEYRDSPISRLPVNDWLSQIVIKATRAQMATNDTKIRDELLDTACYCILLLDKMDRESIPGES